MTKRTILCIDKHDQRAFSVILFGIIFYFLMDAYGAKLASPHLWEGSSPKTNLGSVNFNNLYIDGSSNEVSASCRKDHDYLAGVYESVIKDIHSLRLGIQYEMYKDRDLNNFTVFTADDDIKILGFKSAKKAYEKLGDELKKIIDSTHVTENKECRLHNFYTIFNELDPKTPFDEGVRYYLMTTSGSLFGDSFIKGNYQEDIDSQYDSLTVLDMVESKILLSGDSSYISEPEYKEILFLTRLNLTYGN